jgi:signal transduction histidine kinase
MGVALSMLPESKARTSLDRNIRELNTMITELLENERLAVLGGKLVTEQFDVVALVRSIIDSLGADTRRLEFDSLTESLSIVADNQRLAIAVKNVISNALKYSSEADGPVKVTVFPDDEGVRVVVADSGIGIPPEAQEKVFEPFYRTDDSRSRATGGYGLGLSLTKSIVEAHGGTIQLKSTVGSGTTINMWIPNTPIPEAVVRTVTSREPARERVA